MTRSIAEADRDYAPGDIILQLSRPLLYVTKYEHRLFTCENCFRKTNSSTVCSACRKVYYCDRKCQDQHWQAIHRLECSILSRHKPLTFETNGYDYMQRLTLRLYLLMSSGEEDVEARRICSQNFRLHNGGSRRLLEMEYHPNELKDTPQFHGILQYFKLYQITEFDYDLLLRSYGILHVNSFGIDCYQNSTNLEAGQQSDETRNNHNYDDDSGGDVTIEHRGTGLYVEASVFDHSCVPNAAASGDALTLEIRALSPIARGETIYIDYLQDVLPPDERERILRERYFFRCQCARGCGCAKADSKFDAAVDFKRYSVLNRLIDSLLSKQQQQQQQQPNVVVDWTQLYRCWKQRLRLQERYYAAARYHPCLSMFYREFLRFLLVNRHRLNGSSEGKIRNETLTSASSDAEIAEIEQDLLEFAAKARQHLAITHGVNHAYYSRLFSSSSPTIISNVKKSNDSQTPRQQQQ